MTCARRKGRQHAPTDTRSRNPICFRSGIGHKHHRRIVNRAKTEKNGPIFIHRRPPTFPKNRRFPILGNYTGVYHAAASHPGLDQLFNMEIKFSTVLRRLARSGTSFEVCASHGSFSIPPLSITDRIPRGAVACPSYHLPPSIVPDN